jgi:hypothetical protein
MKIDSETPFRIMALIGSLMGMGIRAYWQRQMKGVEKDALGYEGRDKSPKGLPTYALLFVLPYIFTRWVDFAHLPIPRWLRWLGVAMGSAATAAFAWTLDVGEELVWGVRAS